MKTQQIGLRRGTKRIMLAAALTVAGLAGQIVAGPNDDAPVDYSKYIKPHKWDFSSGLAGWENFPYPGIVEYGDSYEGGQVDHAPPKKWHWEKKYSGRITPF